MNKDTYKFNSNELKTGKCKSCSEMSNEVLKTTGICLECTVLNKVANDLMNKL